MVAQFAFGKIGGSPIFLPTNILDWPLTHYHPPFQCKKIMEAVDLDNIFFHPLSQQALEEMENLKLELQNVPYEEDTYDQWKPFQGTGYSSKKFYDFAFSTVQAGTIFSQI